MQRPCHLAYLTYKDLRSGRHTLAVLPWGATEAHNIHLPYGTDILETEHIAVESARWATERGAAPVVLPAVPFGVNTGQLDIPLVINVNPTTQFALLRDVIDSLEHEGIRKLLVLNGHGGNDFKWMIRELQPKTSVMLCTLNWYTFVDPAPFFDEPGDHAGEMETSLMLCIAPEYVLPLSEAGDGAEHKMTIPAFRTRKAWVPRQWSKVTRDTGVGNPRKASAEKGKRYLDALTEAIGGFLLDLDRADLNNLYERQP